MRTAGRDNLATAGDEIQNILGIPALIASGPMKQVMDLVKRAAQSNAAVLITGESGSGKEVVARALHHYSLRCGKPWVDVNCGALPDHLMESELFGYEKGAFSGADSTKPGMFELAHTGTLFLDEIGELDMKMQVKLLRVLDGTPYYRLGGVRKTSVDVRVIAATNNHLEEAIKERRFRGDLYHRLNQIHIHVPPLRERPEDIRGLADLFLNQANPRLHYSPQTIQALVAYSWPGNVRELKNVVTRAAVMAADSEILPSDLPPELVSQTARAFESATTLDGMEKAAIMQALARTGGHQEKAAQALGISRRTLIRKLKLYAANPEPAGTNAYCEMAAC
jgi:transcriptional regulator with PAS, ATPase and Fis domain